MTKAVIPMSQTLAMMGRDDILIAVHQVKKEDKELLFRYGIVAAFDETASFEETSLTMLRLLISLAKEAEREPDAY